MRILVDADALPGEAKRILFRAAERERIELVLVANKPLKVPASSYLSSIEVGAGLDIADDWIVEQSRPEDLIITADIPLASRIVDRGGHALNPRGELYTDANVKERLAMRNLMDELRGAAVISGGGPPPYNKQDVQRFSTYLNNFLTAYKRKG